MSLTCFESKEVCSKQFKFYHQKKTTDKEDKASWVSFFQWLRHAAGTQWGNKKYMNVKHLETACEDASIAGCFHSCQSLQTNV